MYYADAALTQRLDLLLHLTQYGNELLLVTAEQGGGKTCLLHQFKQRAQTHWHIGHITATATSSKVQIIKQIYQQLDLQPESLTQTPTTKVLKRELEMFLLAKSRVVLLVDDADKLPIEALEVLLELSTIIDKGKSPLQLVLFCQPQIKIKLAAPELEQKRFLKQRKIDLPVLNVKQTDSLIQHRLHTAGMQGSKVFTRTTIEKIYKLSAGNPDRICTAAHQILTDSTPKERHSFFPLNYILDQPFPRLINSLAILSVAILLGGLLYFQDNINAVYQYDVNPETQWPAKRQTQLALEIPHAGDGVKNSDSVANAKLPPVQPIADRLETAESAKREIPQTALAQHDTESKSAIPGANSTKPPAPVLDKLATGLDEKMKLAATTGPVHKQTPPSPPVTSQRTPPKNPLAIKRQTDWILAQKSDYYTLQLMAGYNLSTIQNFLKQYRLNQDNIAYYLSYNKGKAWHSLVYGIFPDRATARLAIKDLPPELVAAKPWIRKLHYIKRDINDAI